MSQLIGPRPPHALKVAILHYACAPVVGGVEAIISTHARLLARAGHEPFIIAGRGDPASAGLDGVILPELDSRHPEIVRVQKALLAGGEEALEEFEAWTGRIYGLLEEALAGADICVVHNAFTLHKNLPLTIALARLAEGHRSPRFVAWCHDLAWNNPLYASELEPRWPWTALKHALPNVAYVAISEQRQEEMADLFGVPPGTITLVPNGIDPEAFLPCSQQMREIRKSLRWDEREWVFLSPLRITRRKNLEFGLQIIADMRDMGARPLLVITGPPGPHNVRSGEYFEELLDRRQELGIEDEVAFLAQMGREEGEIFRVSDELMVELYWWADAILMPSQQEGFGLPLLEAGIVRMPVFCSDIPVLREVGGHDVTYFDPSGDPRQVAEMILLALRKPGPTRHRRAVLSTYSWDNIINTRMLPLFERLLGENRASPATGEERTTDDGRRTTDDGRWTTDEMGDSETNRRDAEERRVR